MMSNEWARKVLSADEMNRLAKMLEKIDRSYLDLVDREIESPSSLKAGTVGYYSLNCSLQNT